MLFQQKIIPKQVINPINYKNLFFKKHLKFSYANFNSKLKNILGIRDDIILIGRARTGIYLLIKHYLRETKNKIVLVSSFTIPDIINMVICAGGEPVFIDFEKKSTNVSLSNLLELIKIKQPSILLLTHYSINDFNYKEIYKLCLKNNIVLIEDSAISFAGSSGKVNINSLSNGSIFSFSSFKFINYFYGGALRSKDPSIFKNISKEVNGWERMSFFNYANKALRTLLYNIFFYDKLYNYLTIYIIRLYIFFRKEKKKYTNFDISRMDGSYFKRPSLGCIRELFYKLDNANLAQEKRRRISLIYFKYLRKYSIPINVTKERILNSSCYNYLIYLDNSEKIKKKLLESNFDVGKIFYENCHDYKFFRNIYGVTRNISDLIDNLIVLPTHYKVTQDYAKRLCLKLLSIIKNDC